ncbi:MULTISPECIES: glycine cleavage system protein GcvH [Actinoalloteichus]|uniref:Glycine cleavage system H protein n=1 Tax=Actinoalloteichus fjordicus TaxID=1612552 RepID=A0AAC9LBK5_9PSEU|nr:MULTISPECIES: glycine cleavage system protein GcvH [Actinoalloteichus]APU14336.1 glycine cleavage system H protein [Actinoalloteichus fjordicus]APU20305.1 glycine cleavage system H protein [Actinoalloteichus sp. GBA129-24]
MSSVPQELRFTQDHEWLASGDQDTVRIGITDYAQQQLGDVVFVQLPQVGENISQGETIGEVESTKSVSDVFAPVTGEVVSRNDELEESPELVNSDPYGAGWMIEVRLADPKAFEELLDADGYSELIAGQE